MRVGLVIYGSLETLTGGYLYDRRLVDHLASHGDQVEVISLPWRSYPRHLGDNVSPWLARRLVEAHVDVLLQDELNHPSLVLMNRWIRKRADCPIVAVVHVLRSSEREASRLRPVYAAIERRYLATVDAAVFVCEATRTAVGNVLGRPLPGVVAYPSYDHLTDGQDPPSVAMAKAMATEERRWAEGPLRVLSVANVVPGKGVHVLIKSLARLRADSWRLTVVGSLTMDRPYVERIRRMIAHAGLGDTIELVGAVPNAEIPRYLAASHVLVVPSAYEAFAIAYLEAMSLGVPVIASTAGGAGEIIEQGREGFLVAPRDVDALTRHLSLLLTDRELLRRMGHAARRRVEHHPTWDQSLGQVRAYLSSVVERHAGRQRQFNAEEPSEEQSEESSEESLS